MELILWRHAEAEDNHPDLERPLTAKGLKQAATMADWLKQHMPANTRILVSPALRTQQTAQTLGMDFTTVDSLGPGTTAHALLEAADWPTSDSVLVVGHQPTLGMVAALLMTGRARYWCIKKSAVWWLSNRVRDDEEQCILRAAISPEFR